MTPFWESLDFKVDSSTILNTAHSTAIVIVYFFVCQRQTLTSIRIKNVLKNKLNRHVKLRQQWVSRAGSRDKFLTYVFDKKFN